MPQREAGPGGGAYLTPSDRYRRETVPAATHSIAHLAGTGHRQVGLETTCRKDRTMKQGTEIWGMKMVSDCMEPTIPKGAITILDPSVEVKDGDIALAGLSDGRGYLRYCYDMGDKYWLVAENPSEDNPEVVEVDKADVEVLAAASHTIIGYEQFRRFAKEFSEKQDRES